MKSWVSLFVAILLAFVFSAPALADVDYVVGRGDSMYGVAKRFGIPGQMVVQANRNFKNPNLIHPGEKLVIPIDGEAEMAPVEVRPEHPPFPAPLPDRREVEINNLNNRLGAAEERMTDLEALLAERAGLFTALERERDGLKRELGEYRALLSTSPWHRDVLPKALPLGWPIYAAGLVFFLTSFAFLLLFLKKRRELRHTRAMLENEAREKMHCSDQVTSRMDELVEVKNGLATDPIEEVLADRARIAREMGLPAEERGEVLRGVLKHFFGDLAEDRKPALRATLRYFFPEGKALYREGDTEISLDVIRGTFNLRKDGKIDLSVIVSMPDGREIAVDHLKRFLEDHPEFRVRLGIPSRSRGGEEELVKNAPASENVSDAQKQTPSPEEKEEAKEAYNRLIKAHKMNGGSATSEVSQAPYLT